jgi:hypothetical protein
MVIDQSDEKFSKAMLFQPPEDIFHQLSKATSRMLNCNDNITKSLSAFGFASE